MPGVRYQGIQQALGSIGAQKAAQQQGRQDFMQKILASVIDQEIKRKYAAPLTKMVGDELYQYDYESRKWKTTGVKKPTTEQGMGGLLEQLKTLERRPPAIEAPIPERPEVGVTPEMTVPGLGRGRIGGILPEEEIGARPATFPSITEQFRKRGIEPTITRGKIGTRRFKEEKIGKEKELTTSEKKAIGRMEAFLTEPEMEETEGLTMGHFIALLQKAGHDPSNPIFEDALGKIRNFLEEQKPKGFLGRFRR